MYNHSFISMSVSSVKLKLVKVNESKEISKAITIEMPEGLLAQGKVQKPQEFSQFLKQIWKRERIREKTVGIILPEFATYTKTLNLPKLPTTELDEAIRWQAREFLPHEGSEMILDWKITKELPEGYEVLIVAIEVDVLSGFVGALNEADLLPIFVETTSLCLERLAELKDASKLVCYCSHGSFIATVINGKNVLTTTVLNHTDDKQLYSVLSQILARFHNLGIQKIAVCGNGLTQEFVNTLHTKTQLPIELLRVSVKGISEAQIQEYIIALSQQFVNPDEPANMYSINLLPPSWVTHYRNQVRDLRIWTASLISSVVLWSCLLATLACYILLSQRATSTTKESTPQSAEFQQVVADITRLNAVSGSTSKLFKTFSSPQPIVNLLKSKSVAGVTLNAYDVNLETSKVIVGGIADTREHLLAFKSALESQKEFTKVVLPLNNLLAESNISFAIQMDYKRQ